MESNYKDIYISRKIDKSKIGEIVSLLHKSEWASERADKEIEKSIENSYCYIAYTDENKIVGFARNITDFVTTFYLMDVIVEEAYRGHGIGKMLMDTIMEDVGDLYGILHTDSAQKFYEAYGFVVTSISESGESIMERKRKYD